MDGLTNIIAKIDEQNALDCKAVTDAAAKKAEEIILDAKKEAQAILADSNAKTKAKIDVINSKSLSTADLEYKRVMLAEKSKIIDSVIKDSLKSIYESDDETYFGYIKTLLLSNAADGNGIMKMSDRDLKRMPDNFEKDISALLGTGKSITVSKDAADCDGGFIIEYPEIKIDCTFSSLMDDKSDIIRDQINRVLFA